MQIQCLPSSSIFCEDIEPGLEWLPVCCCCCFFCLAREFWNQTCVTRLLSPVICAIRSRSCPSGFESNWKFACKTCICSSVKVVRTRFVLAFCDDSESEAEKNVHIVTIEMYAWHYYAGNQFILVLYKRISSLKSSINVNFLSQTQWIFIVI